MNLDAEEAAVVAEAAARPGARRASTLTEIWNTEWARAGLDTVGGVGQPLLDAQLDLSGAIERAAGMPVEDYADARSVRLQGASFDDRSRMLTELADALPEDKRKALEPLRDVRLNAARKAQKIEADADEAYFNANGLSAVAMSWMAGLARATVDPVNLAANIAAGPIGGRFAGPALQVVGRQAAAGAIAQAAVEPYIEPARAQLGLEAGFGRAAGNVVEAGIAGGVLAGVGLAVPAAVRRLRGAPAASTGDIVVPKDGTSAPSTPAPNVAARPPVADIPVETLDAVDRLALRDAVMDTAAPVRTAAALADHAGHVDAAASAINAGRTMEPAGDVSPLLRPHRVAVADGSAIDVRPMVVEASSLKTSADAGYDASLQPRQRDRAASVVQVAEIASRFDPERMGHSAEADRGAPIVGPDGMVESGNGRVMAVREVYRRGAEQAQAYRDWFASNGIDVSGFREPVLVRQRMTELTGEQRIAFTLAANQSVTLAMSAPERALGDARVLSADTLALLKHTNDLGAVGNGDFVRAFVGGLPAADRGLVVNSKGYLSQEGLIRVRNALLAKAYGNAPILTRVAEAASDDVKSLSNGLLASSPHWAMLRADIAAGRVPPEFDLTPELMEAASRTADLRAKGVKASVYLDASQADAFDARSPEVDNFVRMFYNGDRAASGEAIAERLQAYVRTARSVSTEPGLDLGLAPVSAEAVQRAALDKNAAADLFTPAERPAAPPAEAKPAAVQPAAGNAEAAKAQAVEVDAIRIIGENPDLEIMLPGPDGEMRRVKAADAFKEADDAARAAQELRDCIGGIEE